jgi:hypothetical protein
LDGTVLRIIEGRGAVIETSGTLVQGVWGNGRRVIGTLRMEPDDGLESLFGSDFETQYRGSIIITRRPLRATGLQVIEDQSLNGIIAPSMEADLIDEVISSSRAILLTEGFGAIRMSAAISATLATHNGRSATLDAVLPNRWQTRRPEVIINPSGRASTRSVRPNLNMTLQPGTAVRLARLPNIGAAGKVIRILPIPIRLANGLRARCAEVETAAGERLTVPLDNLEVFGR